MEIELTKEEVVEAILVWLGEQMDGVDKTTAKVSPLYGDGSGGLAAKVDLGPKSIADK